MSCFDVIFTDLVGGKSRRVLFCPRCRFAWLRLGERALLGYVPEVLYQYRVSPHSISGGLNPSKLAFVRSVEDCRALRSQGLSEEPVLNRCRNFSKTRFTSSRRAESRDAVFPWPQSGVQRPDEVITISAALPSSSTVAPARLGVPGSPAGLLGQMPSNPVKNRQNLETASHYGRIARAKSKVRMINRSWRYSSITKENQMALLLKGGSVFLHVPKTGGRWVGKVLTAAGLVESNLGHMHADADRVLFPFGGSGRHLLTYLLKRRMGLLPRTNPFMFCFVRNPLDWYESFFNYNCEPGVNWRYEGEVHDPDNWHPNAPLNGLGSKDFNCFIRNVISKYPGYVTEMYGRFATPQTSFVGKQEHLCEDLITVLKKLQVPFDEAFIRGFDKVGVSPKRSSGLIWDPELKAEVIRLEYAGLKRWGYVTSNGTVNDTSTDNTEGCRTMAHS